MTTTAGPTSTSSTSARIACTTTTTTAPSATWRKRPAQPLAIGPPDQPGETSTATAFLDLFVPGYVHYDIDHPMFAGKGGVPAGACQYRGVDVFCGPLGLLGEPDHLFHNNGDGSFTDVSLHAGVSDPQLRYGFASVFADLDDDGWPDLAVANDSSTNYLYRNRRDGTFEDVSYASGFALSEEGRAQAAMGIAIGDYNRDGKLDLFVTTFSDDNKTLYRNEGRAAFTDVSFRAAIGVPTIPFLSWGYRLSRFRQRWPA